LHLLSYIPAVPLVTTYYALEVDPREYLEYLHVTLRIFRITALVLILYLWLLP
jgi:hypothetical protein